MSLSRLARRYSRRAAGNAGLKEADAKHVMYAAANACDYFDTRDLLPKRSAIESICPQLNIVTPVEALAAIGTA